MSKSVNEYQAFYEMVKKWTVSDYRTQKIKSEVIIDMLISEFIQEIAYFESDDIKATPLLLAKEFPITRVGQRTLHSDLIEKIKVGTVSSDELDKRQYASVDYLLKSGNTFYLTELKTTNSSINGIQFLNMLWTCDRGVKSLYFRFYDVIKNYCIPENDLPAKKYLYTLKFMLGQTACNDEKFDIAAFGRYREKEEKRKEIAEKIMEHCFSPSNFDTHECKMKMLYICLNDEENLGDKIFKEGLKKLSAKSAKDAIKDYWKELKEEGYKARCDKSVAHPIVIKKLIGNDAFLASLESQDKKEKWLRTSEILQELLVPSEKWF